VERGNREQKTICVIYSALLLTAGNREQGTGNRVESLLASGFVLKISTSFI
jgi:hypothetical protein